MSKSTLLLRRSIYVLLLLLKIHLTTNAQTDINTSFTDRMNYIFQPLEKNRVPNGLLLDYAMEFTNLSNFNGIALTDSNFIMAAEFWDIYNTLYLSRIHSNGFTIQSPSVFDSLWYNQREYGKIVLSGLFYNYSRFKDEAVQSNLITIQNEQTLDRYVNGTWQNPYQTEKVFAVSPSIEFYEGKTFQVILPSNLWQTNAAAEFNNINIDFGDGVGYRALTIGQPITLNYADTGIKEWKYRLQLTSGQYIYSHSKVQIKNAIGELSCSTCRFGEMNPETLPFTADEEFQGIAARGFITIRYRDADRGLRRPLIVVEGFDAGHITNPELQFGTLTSVGFLNSVDDFNTGSLALENVITNLPEYDIIYVDWRNGTDFLQRNGLLLQTIIRWVNENKEPLPGGGFADNVILGQSMGGVITRWALRDMETRLGQQHNTRLFISMDAPQQGANVPAAYQHLARHARSIYLQTGLTAGVVELIQFFSNGLSPYRALSLADRPASRQMLINWVDGTGNINNTVYEEWQTELRNLGYPTQDNIRNIAISNGTECGTTQPFSPGAELLNVNGKSNTRLLGDLLGQIAFPIAGVFLNQPGFLLGVLPGRNDIRYEFIANAQPNQGVSQRIYRGKITYTKKILWLIPVTTTITERNNNSNSTLLPLDYYPGGEINTSIDLNNIDFQNALVRFNLNISHIPTFNFIPTPSALDIGFNNIALNNSDYLEKYVGGVPPIAPRNTPFQNFVTAFNNQRRNEQHIGFFARNGDWLAQELTQIGNPPANAPITSCIAFCENGIIDGAEFICSFETFTAPFGNGVTYTWSVDKPWLVTTNPNGNICEIIRNGNSAADLTITVQITGACGTTTLTKNVTVGYPMIYYNINPNSTGNECYTPNAFYYFNIEPGQNDFLFVNGYEWGYRPYNSTNETIVGDPNTVNTTVTIIFPSTGVYEVFVRPKNDCGIGVESSYFVEVVSMCGGMGWFRVTASPNPSKDDLFITIDQTTVQTKSSNKIENLEMALYDLYSKQIVRQWKFLNNHNQYKLNVRGLKKGIYILQVSRNKQIQSQQIIIQ